MFDSNYENSTPQFQSDSAIMNAVRTPALNSLISIVQCYSVHARVCVNLFYFSWFCIVYVLVFVCARTVSDV